AENTGGQFFAANNAKELTEALAQVSVAKPQPPAKVEVKLRATDQKGGPVIEQGLIWTVRNGATGKVVYQSAAPEGSVAVEMLRGVHDASVLRVSDEAGADGEIETGTNGTTVTLPIIVKLKASLKAPASAPAGSLIEVAWTGPAFPGDYIGIFAVGDEGNRFGDISQDNAVKGEPAELRLPSKPGPYEVRYIVRKNYEAIASEQITVTPVKATLDVPPSAPAAASITIEWTGPGYPGDYIGIFPVGDEGSRYGISEVRLVQGEPAKLQLPSKPGSYEVRYVVRKGYKSIGSEPIEVTKPK
ncbi:MAG: hypothetical protein L0H29_10625, partial [Sinobacteraceae bacterium]|nr:hypothetical protein [Nevskiaceae bacterium]